MDAARPDIHLHIDRLILEGLDVPFAQRAHVQAAVEAELARLLSEGGLAPTWQSGGAVPDVRAGEIMLTNFHNPVQLGHQIAHGVYRGIGP